MKWITAIVLSALGIGLIKSAPAWTTTMCRDSFGELYVCGATSSLLGGLGILMLFIGFLSIFAPNR